MENNDNLHCETTEDNKNGGYDPDRELKKFSVIDSDVGSSKTPTTLGMAGEWTEDNDNGGSKGVTSIVDDFSVLQWRLSA